MSTDHIRLACLVCLISLCLDGVLSTAASEGERVEQIVRYAKAAEIHNYMNESYDPCENFYDFACGNYYRINPPTAQSLKSSFFQKISKALNRKIATVLQSDNDADTKKVKNFYESCMNVPSLMSSYKFKLQEIINEFGQMPALEGDKWRESEFDWLKTVAEIAHKYNNHIILGYFIGVDDANNTINRMRILLQDVPLQSASIYTDDEHALLRHGHQRVMIHNLMNFLGLEEKLAEQTAKEILTFETHLFAGYNHTDYNHTQAEEEDVAADSVDVSAVPKNLITIAEMQSRYYPQLDIERLINISLGFVPTDPVYDLIEREVDNIAILMKETPKRIVANYIFYYLLENVMFTTPEDSNLLQDLCIKMTKSYFNNILDNMVYRKYISKQMEQDVDNMWHIIKSTFQMILESNKFPWMKGDTRRNALEKLKTIRMEINSYDQTNFTKEFGPLTINNHDLIENIKSIMSLSAVEERAQLYEPPKPYDDPEVLSFTPVYILTENLIKVPVSILQPFYLWSDTYPNALKFATLGFLLSHELLHGFDEDGRNFDITGNKHEWWDKASNEYFNNQTQCFSSQYHGYVYDGQFLPELKSQSENTADNGGIRLAYDSYLRWSEDAMRTYEKLDMESMPRLNFTSKQLFFISYGQLWCSATHPVLRNFAASTDEHVPEKFRVIGPLSNLQEFSKVFNCPQGSGMNPMQKCIIY